MTAIDIPGCADVARHRAVGWVKDDLSVRMAADMDEVVGVLIRAQMVVVGKRPRPGGGRPPRVMRLEDEAEGSAAQPVAAKQASLARRSLASALHLTAPAVEEPEAEETTEPEVPEKEQEETP